MDSETRGRVKRPLQPHGVVKGDLSAFLSVKEVEMSVRRYEAICLIALYGLSVAVKLLWIRDVPGPTVFFDELIYRQQAYELFQGEALRSAQYPMGYPLFLSGAFRFENWYGAMHVLNVLISSLLIPASWFLARTVGVRWALVPALLCALLPIHSVFPGYIMSDDLPWDFRPT